jgi:hypothetical protein
MRRSGLAAAAVVAVVVAVVLVWLLRDTGGGPSGPAARPARTSAAAVSFDWAGQPNRPFTQEQLDKVASRFSVLVIAKFHAGGETGAQDDDARALAALNPSLKLFANYTMRFLPMKQLPALRTLGFQDRWLLRYTQPHKGNQVGEPVVKGEPGDRHSAYVNVADPAYRAWLLDVVGKRMADAPYAGIAFDNYKRLDDDPGTHKKWLKILGPQELAAWDRGLKQFPGEFKARFPDKLFLFNGIARKKNDSDRGVDILRDTPADMAMDEFFCWDDDAHQLRPPDQLVEDAALLHSLGRDGKTVLDRIKFRKPDDPKRALVSRVCSAIFLLGYVPGHGYYKFGIGPQADKGELDVQSPEMFYALGKPLGDMTRSGSLLERRFAGGHVYYNAGSAAATVRAPSRLADAESETLVTKGEALTVDPGDALFLVKPA